MAKPKSAPRGEAGAELDALVGDVAAAMLVKYPTALDSPGVRFERAMARAAKDRDVADRAAVRARKPMGYVDDSAGSGRVFLPPGVFDRQ